MGRLRLQLGPGAGCSTADRRRAIRSAGHAGVRNM